jgi:hypothetical protein
MYVYKEVEMNGGATNVENIKEDRRFFFLRFENVSFNEPAETQFFFSEFS